MENERFKGLLFFSIFCFIIIVSTSIGFMKHENNSIVYFSRRYLPSDRYEYKHIIGNYTITTKFGDIYLKTGNKIQDHKGYLGTLFDIENHTIKILDNDIQKIDTIHFHDNNNFSIKLLQDINIQNKTFRIDRIFFHGETLNFHIIDFPGEIILNDNTRIKLFLDESLFWPSIRIIENQLYLEVENFRVGDHYFHVQQGDSSYKCMKILIGENWERIIDYE